MLLEFKKNTFLGQIRTQLAGTHLMSDLCLTCFLVYHCFGDAVYGSPHLSFLIDRIFEESGKGIFEVLLDDVVDASIQSVSRGTLLRLPQRRFTGVFRRMRGEARRRDGCRRGSAFGRHWRCRFSRNGQNRLRSTARWQGTSSGTTIQVGYDTASRLFSNISVIERNTKEKQPRSDSGLQVQWQKISTKWKLHNQHETIIITTTLTILMVAITNSQSALICMTSVWIVTSGSPVYRQKFPNCFLYGTHKHWASNKSKNDRFNAIFWPNTLSLV